MKFDKVHWKDVVGIVDEAFDSAINGMREAMDKALQDMKRRSYGMRKRPSLCQARDGYSLVSLCLYSICRGHEFEA